MLYRNVMDETQRENLVHNIVISMKGIEGIKKDEIINRQLCHFFRTDIHLGVSIAKGLGVVLDEKVMSRVIKKSN